eukprot:gene4086-2934_t
MDFDDSTDDSVKSGPSWEEESLGNRTDNTYGTLHTVNDTGLRNAFAGATQPRAPPDVLVLEDPLPDDAPAQHLPVAQAVSLHHTVIERNGAEDVDDPDAVQRPPSRHGCLAAIHAVPPHNFLRAEPGKDPSRFGVGPSDVVAQPEMLEGAAGMLLRPVSPSPGDASARGDRSPAMYSSTASHWDPVVVEESSRWSHDLKDMGVLDISIMCRTYSFPEDGELRESDDSEPIEGLLKVMNFYPATSANGAGAHAERARILDCLQYLIHSYEESQNAFLKNGLLSPEFYDDESVPEDVSPDESPLCRGYKKLHLDSSCRLLVELDVEPYSVPLSNVVAFSCVPLSIPEFLSILRSTVSAVGRLHKLGLAHGSLHAGNILFSTNDGHCAMSQPGGIAANTLFPSDPSYLSPRQAAKLEDLFRVVDHRMEDTCSLRRGRLGEPRTRQREETIVFLLEALKLPYGDSPSPEASGVHSVELDSPPTRPLYDPPDPSDDVYAIGVLTLFLLFGVPVLYGRDLKGATKTLSLAQQRFREAGAAVKIKVAKGSMFAAQKEVLRRLFYGTAWNSEYARCRFREAQYTEGFLDDVEDFVLQCLMTGFMVEEDKVTSAAATEHELFPQSAAPLLNHRLFSHLDEVIAGDTSYEEYAQDTCHRVVYPIYTTERHIIEHCGTSPYVARFHRNSIFASRCNALLRPKISGGTIAHGSASFPLLSGDCPTWVRGRVGLEALPLAMSRRCEFQKRQSSDETGKLDFLMLSQEFLFPRDSLMLHFTQKEQRRHHMMKYVEDTTKLDFPGGTPECLILSDLAKCSVEVTVPVSFIFCRRVTECSINLAPTIACYMDEVSESDVNVAATYLLVDRVEKSKIGFAGVQLVPLSPENFHPATIEPYGFLYPGVSEGFAQMGLPQERAGSREALITGPRPLLDRATSCRNFTFATGDQPHYDYPYSHALVAVGNKFVHKGDDINDVYLLNDEVEGKDIFISDIRGDRRPLDVGESGSPFAADGDSPRDANNINFPSKNKKFPLICILSAVGDVTIEDCSHCTVVVVGSRGAVSIQRCEHMTVVFLCRECVIENCNSLVVMAIITEYLVAKKCVNVDIQPLYIQCPNFDIILEIAVDEAEDTDQAQKLHAALAKRNMDHLNVILQPRDNVVLSECSGVTVRDAAWFSHNPNQMPSLLTISISDDTEGEGSMDGGSAPAPPHNTFMTEYMRRLGDDASSCFSCVSLQDVLYENSATRQPELQTPLRSSSTSIDASEPVPSFHRIHDLVDTFILRTPHSLSLRSKATDEHSIVYGRDETADGGDVVSVLLMEHIFGGQIHIMAAVKELVIRDCHGPLEIAVCAAAAVALENCNNVTLRVACGSFAAAHCFHCHTALHVNLPPTYRSCEAMLISALNMTAVGMERYMAMAGVTMDKNEFRAPSTGRDRSAVTCRPAADGVQSKPCALEPLNLLRFGVTVVPPLPGLCLGVVEAPFLEALEAPFETEKSRVPIPKQWAAALCETAESALRQFTPLPSTNVTPSSEETESRSSAALSWGMSHPSSTEQECVAPSLSPEEDHGAGASNGVPAAFVPDQAALSSAANDVTLPLSKQTESSTAQDPIAAASDTHRHSETEEGMISPPQQPSSTRDIGLLRADAPPKEELLKAEPRPQTDLPLDQKSSPSASQLNNNPVPLSCGSFIPCVSANTTDFSSASWARREEVDAELLNGGSDAELVSTSLSPPTAPSDSDTLRPLSDPSQAPPLSAAPVKKEITSAPASHPWDDCTSDDDNDNNNNDMNSADTAFRSLTDSSPPHEVGCLQPINTHQLLRSAPQEHRDPNMNIAPTSEKHQAAEEQSAHDDDDDDHFAVAETPSAGGPMVHSSGSDSSDADAPSEKHPAAEDQSAHDDDDDDDFAVAETPAAGGPMVHSSGSDSSDADAPSEKLPAAEDQSAHDDDDDDDFAVAEAPAAGGPMVHSSGSDSSDADAPSEKHPAAEEQSTPSAGGPMVHSSGSDSSDADAPSEKHPAAEEQSAHDDDDDDDFAVPAAGGPMVHSSGSDSSDADAPSEKHPAAEEQSAHDDDDDDDFAVAETPAAGGPMVHSSGSDSSDADAPSEKHPAAEEQSAHDDDDDDDFAVAETPAAGGPMVHSSGSDSSDADAPSEKHPAAEEQSAHDDDDDDDFAVAETPAAGGPMVHSSGSDSSDADAPSEKHPAAEEQSAHDDDDDDHFAVAETPAAGGPMVHSSGSDSSDADAPSEKHPAAEEQSVHDDDDDDHFAVAETPAAGGPMVHSSGSDSSDADAPSEKHPAAEEQSVHDDVDDDHFAVAETPAAGGPMVHSSGSDSSDADAPSEKHPAAEEQSVHDDVDDDDFAVAETPAAGGPMVHSSGSDSSDADAPSEKHPAAEEQSAHDDDDDDDFAVAETPAAGGPMVHSSGSDSSDADAPSEKHPAAEEQSVHDDDDDDHFAVAETPAAGGPMVHSSGSDSSDADAPSEKHPAAEEQSVHDDDDDDHFAVAETPAAGGPMVHSSGSDSSDADAPSEKLPAAEEQSVHDDDDDDDDHFAVAETPAAGGPMVHSSGSDSSDADAPSDDSCGQVSLPVFTLHLAGRSVPELLRMVEDSRAEYRKAVEKSGGPAVLAARVTAALQKLRGGLGGIRSASQCHWGTFGGTGMSDLEELEKELFGFFFGFFDMSMQSTFFSFTFLSAQTRSGQISAAATKSLGNYENGQNSRLRATGNPVPPNPLSRQASLECYPKPMSMSEYPSQHGRQFSNSQDRRPPQGNPWPINGGPPPPHPGNYMPIAPPDPHGGVPDGQDGWTYPVPYHDKGNMSGGPSMIGPFCPSPTGSQGNTSANGLPPSHLSSNGVGGPGFGHPAQPVVYSNGGSPTVAGMLPGYTEATSFFGPASSANPGAAAYRPSHQKTSSGNSSSFATCVSECLMNPGSGGQDPMDIRRLNSIMQEELRRGKKEHQQLRDEMAFFRSRYAFAVGEKRAILDAYRHDVAVLLNAVNGLLLGVEKLSCSGGGETCKAAEKRDNRDARHEKRMALLARAIEGFPETDPKGDRRKKGGRDNAEGGNCSFKNTTEETIRDISNALGLKFEESGWGMSLCKGTSSPGPGQGPTSLSSSAPEQEPLDEQGINEEELRDIAVDTQKHLEAYLHSLNYGFSCGVGRRAPLAVQVPAPAATPFLAGPGGPSIQKKRMTDLTLILEITSSRDGDVNGTSAANQSASQISSPNRACRLCIVGLFVKEHVSLKQSL